MAPLENPELEVQRQELVEEYLRLVGGDENGIPHVLAAVPEVVLVAFDQQQVDWRHAGDQFFHRGFLRAA